MYQKMFVTSDGVQHKSAARAVRHDARRALEEFLRKNLTSYFIDEPNGTQLETVRLHQVTELVVNHVDCLSEFAETYRRSHTERDFTFEEVEDFVILRMAKHTMAVEAQPYSTHYISTTVNKIWDVLTKGAVADGSYSDLQCGLAYEAKRHFEVE